MSNEVATAAPAKRTMMVIEDAIPLLDTARFEHMQRIATVMARASLIPDALRVNDYDTTFANCFLVVNQAVRWGMDPFAVAQSVFVLHGKIGYEGKLIAAVIEEKTGSPLDYEWEGEPGTDAFKITVSGARPSDGKIVSIYGTVGDWKTFEKDGKTVKANWRGLASRNQLAYRGGREWARLFAPGLMLGVYSPDEIEALDDDVRFRGATYIAEEPPGSPKGKRTRKAKDSPAAETITGNQYQGDGKVIDGDGEIVDQQTGEVTTQADAGAAQQEEDPPAAQQQAEPEKKAAPRVLEEVKKPANTNDRTEGDIFLDNLLSEVGPNKPLKDHLKYCHGLMAAHDTEAPMKEAWLSREKMPGMTATEKEAIEKLRTFHKERVQKIAAAAEDEQPPAGDDAGTKAFDYSGFLHELDVKLGAETTGDDVNRVYAEITGPAIEAKVVTPEQVENDLQTMLVGHLERVDF